jgi:hypothetical protein
MRVLLLVPDYDPAAGVRTEWDDGFEVTARLGAGAAVIAANPAGLRSLARHLLAGAHIHLDADNALEPGSCELILERRP